MLSLTIMPLKASLGVAYPWFVLLTHSFLSLNSILSYSCITVCLFTCWWIFWLFPVGSTYEYNCFKHSWLRPGDSVGKESSCGTGDAGIVGSIPGLGRSPGGGHGNPLQYSCLENPMHRGAWQAVVCSVAQSLIRLKQRARTCANIHVWVFVWTQIVLFFLAALGLRCFLCRLSPVAVSGDYSSLQYVGFSLQWLLLWSMGFRHMGVVARELRGCGAQA